MPFKLSLMLTFLVVTKATSTGNECHQLAASMNGFDLITPSMQSLATTPLMTLANENIVALSFWEMARLFLLSATRMDPLGLGHWA